MASMALFTSGWPVKTTTSADAPESRIRRSASIPPIPGIFRSRRRTSKSRVRKCSSASSPLSALVTRYPARGSSFSMRSRVGRSSSTTSTRMAPARSPFSPTSAALLPPLTERKADGHDGPFPEPIAVDLNGALVLLDDALTDSEAQTRSLPPLLGREERIEDLREVFRRDPAPRIRHHHIQPVLPQATPTLLPTTMRGDSYLPTALDRIERIRQQVEEYLLKHLEIGVHHTSLREWAD